MACKEMFEKMREESKMHEELLNQKIKEGNDKLKGILQKIKHEMEKISIYSTTNYEALPIQKEEEKKEMPHQDTLKVSKEKEICVCNSPKPFLSKDKKKKLKMNIKKNLRLAIINKEAKIKRDSLKKEKKIPPPSLIVNEINYCITSHNNTNENNSHSNTASTIHHSNNMKNSSRKRFKSKRKPMKVHKEEENVIKQEEPLQTTSGFYTPVETNNNFYSPESSGRIPFYPSSTFRTKQNNNIPSEHILITSTPNQMPQTFMPQQTNIVPIVNREEQIAKEEDKKEEDIINTNNVNEENSNINNSTYSHKENIEAQSLNETNHELSSSTAAYGNNSSIRPTIKERNKVSILQKKYFALTAQIDLLKRQNAFLKRTKEIPKPLKAKQSKKEEINKLSKSTPNLKRDIDTIISTRNPIVYKDYSSFKLDQEDVKMKVDLINKNTEFESEFKERDYFGEFIDDLIKRSFRMIKNRKCNMCADLLSKGKSAYYCPKHHHKL